MVVPKSIGQRGGGRHRQYCKRVGQETIRSFFLPHRALALCISFCLLYSGSFVFLVVEKDQNNADATSVVGDQGWTSRTGFGNEKPNLNAYNIAGYTSESGRNKNTDDKLLRSPLSGVSATGALAVSPQHRGNHNENEQQWIYEVCFVTAVYSTSVETADKPPSVEEFYDHGKANATTFRFFAFTNLSDLRAPGWTIIVKDLPMYRRSITQSRWPKFMAWQDRRVMGCQAIFYMDGFCGPKLKHVERYKKLANSIATSHFGLFQNVHDLAKGPIHELDRILAKKKDIAKNVEASKAWLLSQPDFNDNCTMYANHYIAYDPRSVYWQSAATFFWSHYSQEQDSWRDQPLWCYVLDKHHIAPTRLGTFEALFRDYFNRMGHSGHRYSNQADNDTIAIGQKESHQHDKEVSRRGFSMMPSSQEGQESATISNIGTTAKTELCFLTSSYSSSVENADKPPGVRKLQEANPTFKFVAFTNLPDLDAPGWTIVTQTFTRYKRHITQSRWPKFLGWKHPLLQKHCPVVFYLDAYCRPKEKFTNKFKLIAQQLLAAPSDSLTGGVAQNLHEWGMGPLVEFDRILEKGKDTPENVNASIRWLKSQPDFNESCTLYSNQYLAYNPSNPTFQKLSQYFWDHYSLEEDSWRDQPLWCYVLHKFGVQPLSSFGSFKTMFKEHKTRMSPSNHRYT